MAAWIGTLLPGLVIGMLAYACQRHREPSTWSITVLLSCIGAFWASYAGYALGIYPEESSLSWIAAAIGALLVVRLYQVVRSPANHDG